jgi:hypothetical protein
MAVSAILQYVSSTGVDVYFEQRESAFHWTHDDRRYTGSVASTARSRPKIRNLARRGGLDKTRSDERYLDQAARVG